MSNSISYRVKLKDAADELHIDAEDLELTCPCGEFAETESEGSFTLTCTHEKAFWNFTRNEGEQTVAAIPYSQVVYITD